MTSVRIERVDGVLHVALAGEIDLAIAEQVGALGEAMIVASPVTEVVTDVAGVTFIDSTGISALVRLHNAAEQSGAPFRVDPASPSVRRLLTVTGLDGVLRVAAGDE